MSFHLLDSVFQRGEILNQVQFIIFLMNWTSGIIFKKSLPNSTSETFLSMFSSGSFIILVFIVSSMINYGFIFIDGTKDGLNFIFSCKGVQFFQHYFLKRLSFLHWISFAYLLKIYLPHFYESISEPSTVLLVYTSILWFHNVFVIVAV